MKTFSTILAAMLLAFATLHAQLVNDGASATLANVTNTIPGGVTVGTNGTGTLLVLSSNALLTNSGNGVVGLNLLARSNEVRLASGSARWQMGGNLFVGSNGVANRLVVSNGALLENSRVMIGNHPGSSNNEVVVNGPGSTLNSPNGLWIGADGNANRLTILNGGKILATGSGGFTTIGFNAGMRSNSALVADPGSRWSINHALFVGGGANANTLVVSNGALVDSLNATIGSAITASNNLVLVTGAGSTWSNSANLRVGDIGSGNQLIASNGGSVFVGGSAIVGLNTFSTSNRMIITDGGTLRATALTVGNIGSGNVLMASNGATVLSSNAVIGGTSSGNSNLVVVTGFGSLWTNRNELFVGSFGIGNRLEVKDGATVQIGDDAWIGGESSADANSATVSDPGTRWQVRLGVYVGSNGAFNRLVITNGALVQSAYAEIGMIFPATTNEVMVTGPGSLFDIDDFLVIGQGSSGNRLVITNGGTVRSSHGRFGNITSARGNQAIVTGAGSLWTNDSSLILGELSDANRLVITNGGEVCALDRIVIGGLEFSSIHNRAIVDGGTLRTANSFGTGTLNVRGGTNVLNAGLVEADQLLLTNLAGLFDFNGGTLITRGAIVSNNNFFIVGRSGTTPAIWDVRPGGEHVVSEFYVGNNQSSNQLLISAGARLESVECFLGHAPTSGNNLALVTGAGTFWTNAQGLYLGYGGPSNQFLVRDGAKVDGRMALIGYNTSSNNTVVVSGPGSSWLNRGELHVGESSRGNRMVISAGGTVSTSTEQIIGNSIGSDSNLVLVTDSGSRWLGEELKVGNNGAFNQLILTNGGVVSLASDTSLGNAPGARGNQVVVAGASSVLMNESNVLVGSFGSANSLLVKDGGLVQDANGILGFSASASNNAAVVTGSGSLWNNDQSLSVGLSSSGNRLTVSGGGTVRDQLGFLGSGNSGSNVVIVTDPGSVWENLAELRVLGTGNQLFLTNGGSILDTDGIVGLGATSRSNLVVVADPGSTWANSQILTVGAAGRGNKLVVSRGGTVRSFGGVIGQDPSASFNVATVMDPGSSWNTELNITVGKEGDGGQLFIGGGGSVSANGIEIGKEPSATNNRVIVAGGFLQVTNSDESVLEVRRGTNVLNAGLVEANFLRLTNRLGIFEFNGGLLVTRAATISNGAPFMVGGPGGVPATWDMRAGTGGYQFANSLIIGDNSPFNRLLVTNGAQVVSLDAGVGISSGGNSNIALVAGTGSRWTVLDEIGVGASGSFNSIIVSNGGWLVGLASYLGFGSGINNRVQVTGASSVWSNRMELNVGYDGSGSQFWINDGATVSANKIIIGSNPTTSSNNLLRVANGTLRAQNADSTGTLDIRNGTNRLDAGLVEVDRLVMSDARGRFEFNGGTLRSAGTTSGNERVFVVGNGVSETTFELRDGTHAFPGGLTIAPHGLLTGNGTIIGGVTVQSGGTLAPGPSLGVLSFSSSPMLQGTTRMEVSTDGPNLSNDDIIVNDTIIYGGSLIVTNIGPNALVEGDDFLLFEAGGYAGAFVTVSLPPLPAGLTWTNKLLVDGSIAVIATPQLRFAGVTLSGTNLILSGTGGSSDAAFTVLTATNVAEPLTNWLSLGTNQFSPNGEFQFTNPVNFGEFQRYFRIRTP